jgi:hypothetical protein
MQDSGVKGLRGLDLGEWLLLLWLGLWLAGLVGWIMNLVKLVAMCCDATGWLALRAVGLIVLPLGAVLGFL